ncbi:MAG TPA: GNAT family N-acetyltransferase [Anaerolineales bacterium]|nr:GNAT family N-acetyltransferase [Anaerolineales bacterium]
MSRQWSIQRGQFWTMDLAQEEIAPVQARIPAEFSEIAVRDVSGIVEAIGRSAEGMVRSRFEGGVRCFVARVGGQLAAYGWASTRAEWIGEMDRDFRIPPGEVYVWDCLTRPEYRRNRLYSALLADMAGRFQREGARRVWIGSNAENRPSIRGFVTAGFQPVAEVILLRLISLRALRVKPMATSGRGLAEPITQALRADGEMRLGEWLVRLR